MQQKMQLRMRNCFNFVYGNSYLLLQRTLLVVHGCSRQSILFHHSSFINYPYNNWYVYLIDYHLFYSLFCCFLYLGCLLTEMTTPMWFWSSCKMIVVFVRLSTAMNIKSVLNSLNQMVSNIHTWDTMKFPFYTLRNIAGCTFSAKQMKFANTMFITYTMLNK